MTLNRGGKMGLSVKRTSIISLESRMELDKKGVGVDLGGKKLKDLLENANKNNNKNNKTKCKDEELKSENISLEEIKSMHQYCLDELNWQGINNIKPPFDINSDGPNKIDALEKYESFQPGFLFRIFKFLEEKKKRELLKDIEIAEMKDKALWGDYEKISQLSLRVLNGDLDCYFQVIDEIRPFDRLLNLGSEVEIGTNDSESMEVEFKVNSEKVIPKSRFNKEISGNDEEVEITYYEMIEEYVCSSILFVAKNIMNIIPVNKVVVHAVDNVVDIDKGAKNDITILSIVFDRETLNKLNIKTVNPIDALDYFICNMRHQKASGFKNVDRIIQY